MTNEPSRRFPRSARNRFVAAVALACAAVLFTADFADARAGRGMGGFGSRGARTFQAPPATQTAPRPAAPIERSVTPNNPGAAQRAPGTGAATAAARPGGMFSRGGFMGGLFAGFLGAGLFGLLFGSGLFSGLGSFASILGLLLQIALVVIVARLLINWYRRRAQPQAAMAGHAPNAEMDVQRAPMQRSSLGLGGGSAPVNLVQGDFDRFESTLVEVQEAYGREDLAKLRTLVTPEMLSFMAEDLADNSSRGVVNEISDVKLEQGDLAESWREERTEYATVAMRYTITDVVRERVSGHVVEGNPGQSDEVTEIWTFRRAPGAGWVVSAIQQA